MKPSKKSIQILTLALLLTAMFCGELFAKMISGQVTGADADTRKVSISTLDPSTGGVQVQDVWVNPDAALTGFRSVGNLRPGGQVWAEAEEDSEGNLRASRVTKS